MLKQAILFLAILSITYSATCNVTIVNCTSCLSTQLDQCEDCVGQYGLLGNYSCEQCYVIGCWKCDGNTSFCTECNWAKGFTEEPTNNRTCSCNETLYLDQVNLNCKACNGSIIGCRTCSRSTVCTECNATAHFVFNRTRCRCADGYYLNSNNVCTLCTEWHSECLTCNSTKCTGCGGEFVVNSTGTNCVPKCSITGCVLCFNSTACTLCAPNSDFSKDLASCPCYEGFFRTGTGTTANCSACIANCASCSAATGCTTCNNGYRFNSNSSTCVLSENYVRLAFAFIVLAVLSFAM